MKKGRPSTFTSKIEAGILSDIEDGKTLKEAAINNGIKPSTLAMRLKRGRAKTKGPDYEFAFKFDRAVIAATEKWEERFKRGDKEIRIEYDAAGDEIKRTEIVKERSSDAWKWLARRVPEKYGDLVYDTEAFLKMAEEKWGPRWAWIFRKVLNAAESSRKTDG